jgi:hypothetical protein
MVRGISRGRSRLLSGLEHFRSRKAGFNVDRRHAASPQIAFCILH